MEIEGAGMFSCCYKLDLHPLPWCLPTTTTTNTTTTTTPTTTTATTTTIETARAALELVFWPVVALAFNGTVPSSDTSDTLESLGTANTRATPARRFDDMFVSALPLFSIRPRASDLVESRVGGVTRTYDTHRPIEGCNEHSAAVPPEETGKKAVQLVRLPNVH